MVKSMTGYGGAKGTSGKLDISIELRSVNNRYLDCNIRLPKVYTAFEDAIKSLVQSKISRGKVDVYITIDTSKSDDIVISVNEPLADAYMSAIGALADKYNISGDISAYTLSRFPDVLLIEKKEADADILQKDICAVLAEALEAFDKMRITEGRRLYDDVLSRIELIENLVSVIEERSPETVAEYRNKLEMRMKEVLESKTIDENRLLLEAAIFADKVAVNEETVRLRSHIAQFREIIEGDEPMGRKLDFLIQEFNREANTMGSKCNDSYMAKTVVDIKAEIEKIREQIQNIE